MRNVFTAWTVSCLVAGGLRLFIGNLVSGLSHSPVEGADIQDQASAKLTWLLIGLSLWAFVAIVIWIEGLLKTLANIVKSQTKPIELPVRPRWGRRQHFSPRYRR